MEKAGWLPVSQTAAEADDSQPQSAAPADDMSAEWQAVDATVSLLCWCGALLTAALLAWLALSGALTHTSWPWQEQAMHSCSAEQSLSASLNVQLLHEGFLRKLLATPAQPVVVGVVGGSVSWGRGGGPQATYAAQFVDWLNTAYPTASTTAGKPQPHSLVNRAQPGASSSAVTLCLEQQFGEQHVDLLLIEFAVNDGGIPYQRVRPSELNLHSSANIERIIRYWQLRGTAVWLIEIPGGIGTRYSVLGQGNLFTPVAEYYGVSVVDSSGLFGPTPYNRYWRELFQDSVHPKPESSALLTALMVRELRFHERVLRKAEDAALGRGELPNGALLVRSGPHSRSAEAAEALLPTVAQDVHPSYDRTEVYPWHGLDVHEAAWSSPLRLCVQYEAELRPPMLPGLVLDDYRGKCYFSDYGASAPDERRLRMRNTSSAGWRYGLDPDTVRSPGNKVGFHTHAPNAALTFDLGRNVRRMVGLLHLDSSWPCGDADVWLTYRSPHNGSEMRWPAERDTVHCTSDRAPGSTSSVHVIQHVQQLRDSLRLPANASLPMQLHVLNLPHEDERNQTRATFFIVYGLVVD